MEFHPVGPEEEAEIQRKHLQFLVNARTEQLREAVTIHEEMAMELDKLKDRLQSRGLVDEVANVQKIREKIK